jgi:tryptophan synthase alpha chain
MGTTGARAELGLAAEKLVGRLRAVGATSACVGIGVSTAPQIAEILSYADGAIVGSALVRALADDGVAGVAALAAALSQGTGR